jgi:hypothetical protein
MPLNVVRFDIDARLRPDTSTRVRTVRDDGPRESRRMVRNGRRGQVRRVTRHERERRDA